MFETIKSGGLIMIPLFICGIIATYIIIERCIYFYKIKKSDVQLMNSVNASLITITPPGIGAYLSLGQLTSRDPLAAKAS